LQASYKDDKQVGTVLSWYPDGQKGLEGSYKNGKVVSAVAWKPNGEKCPQSGIVDGNGVMITYGPDGTKQSRQTYKDGEPVRD
jgi:antitoxin component YwqK of YwqJK toxin-antitoxin module